jgi:hypothetical protein
MLGLGVNHPQKSLTVASSGLTVGSDRFQRFAPPVTVTTLGDNRPGRSSRKMILGWRWGDGGRGRTRRVRLASVRRNCVTGPYWICRVLGIRHVVFHICPHSEGEHVEACLCSRDICYIYETPALSIRACGCETSPDHSRTCVYETSAVFALPQLSCGVIS